MIRVVLADDQPLVRAGFRLILDAEDGISVVGEADDGAAAIALAESERPDLVLMDVRMPRVDGLEATRRIAADDNLASVKILILTTFELDEYVFEALRGRRERLPGQTHPARRTYPSGTRNRRGRGIAVTERHPPADRRVRRPAAAASPDPAEHADAYRAGVRSRCACRVGPDQ
jgi:CheY-like chemotaxis protein